MRLPWFLVVAVSLMGYGTTDVTVLSPDELPSDLYASPSGTSRPAGRPPRTLDAYFVSGERLARR